MAHVGVEFMRYFPTRKDNGKPPVTAIPWRMYILIGVTGLLFTSMVGYGFHITERMNTVFVPLVDAAVKTRLEAKIAALMFEEMNSTGIVWNFETNWEPLDRAVQNLHNQLQQSRHTRWIFLPFRASTMQLEIAGVKETLAELKNLAKKRLSTDGVSLLNLDVKQRYHHVYTKLMSRLKRMEISLRRIMEENSRQFRYTQILLLIACALMSLTVGIAFFMFERRRTRHLLSIFRAKEMMKKEVVERKRVEQALSKRTKALEQSNRDLEQYMYVVSHDLQEPLRMVTSYMQLLSRRYHGRLDKDADQFIDFAVDGGQRMQALIKALLEYSRVGAREKSTKPVNTDKVLNQVLANLKVATEECNAVITRDLLPKVWADESQLVQLFQNLLSNAIKFRGKTPVRIHISAERQTSDWLFSIRDNGVGIDPNFSERIFAIFQRLHTAADYPGTGIGLAICRKIVEHHGGRIWVSSEPGAGATFFFSLSADGVLENEY